MAPLRLSRLPNTVNRMVKEIKGWLQDSSRSLLQAVGDGQPTTLYDTRPALNANQVFHDLIVSGLFDPCGSSCLGRFSRTVLPKPYKTPGPSGDKRTISSSLA